MSATPVLLVDVVGLTPRLLEVMPNLRRVASDGFAAKLDTIFPAVTCSVQSSILTGLLPREHGIVGNGWYFRDLGEVLLWRQHNKLVQGEKVWQAARAQDPSFTTANVCWWYAMGADVDYTVTPRPIYYADGAKEPDCYTHPPQLHDELVGGLGAFPLFTYWGPTAGIASSRWIAKATQRIMNTRQTDLTMVYIPHLDYDLQRFGPDDPRALAAAREIDAELARLLHAARARGAKIVVLSEYGITAARRPIDINRLLRRQKLLEVYTQDGMEYLDPWTSRAFAVADHQVAHVYVSNDSDLGRVRDMLAQLDGVDEVLDADGKKRYGIDHQRAGELVVIAEPDAWFTYYYWLDDSCAPDFARSVEIHRKPGYDPAELFFDPARPMVKLQAAATLAKKKLGLRYNMQVVPLDPSCVRGSHGRLPDDDRDAPMLLCSDASMGRETVHATEVKKLLLDLAGLSAPA